MAKASGGGHRNIAHQLRSEHQDQGCELPSVQGGLVQWESTGFFLPGSAYGNSERGSCQTKETLQVGPRRALCVFLFLRAQHGL